MTGKNEVMIDKSAYSNDDEIDLFDLIDDIWTHKRWVFVGLFTTIILAGLYLFKATPVYQAQTKVKSATANDLIEFTKPQLAGVFSFGVGEAFSSARSALLSTVYLKEFYELNLDKIKSTPKAYSEELSIEQNFTKFKDRLSIKLSGAKDDESYVLLKFESSDSAMASGLVNEFVEYALFRRLRDSYDNMLVKVKDRLYTLNYQADVMREEYFSTKARRILELKEATIIAVAVGQDKPVYRNMDLVGGQMPPLYMLGFEAIKAEIKALESRTEMAKALPRKEDHFIQGLPPILLEIEKLQSLEVDFSKVHLARVDELAVMPVKPIKPRKLLIIALALVAGLFIGLFMALIVAASGKHKVRIEEKRLTKKK